MALWNKLGKIEIKMVEKTRSKHNLGEQLADTVFESIEEKLNKSAEQMNGLKLTIPFVCFSY